MTRSYAGDAVRWRVPPTPRVLTADRGDDGLRLDLVLRRHLTDVRSATRTRVQAWIESGLVTVNGAPIRRVSSRAAFGDIVSIALPDEQPRAAMAAEDVRLEVALRRRPSDRDRQAGRSRRPPDLQAHGADADERAALARARAGRRRSGRRSSAASTSSRRASSSSRRHAAAHAALQRAMAANDSEKDYLAVVYGRVNVARGEIDLRLAQGPQRSAQGRGIGDGRRGEPDAVRAARARGGAARGAVAAPLPSGDRAHAPDPRASGGARLAAGRRSDLRRAAMVAGRRPGARRDAAGISAAGAPRVAGRVHAPDHARAADDRGAGAGRHRRRCWMRPDCRHFRCR